ncbi:hypothetical protein BU25DRAFT_406382 [Macroventuria anomochaeta]|uniref:Uncharacterized protein n=1 Tax=Macroventuria anomochaeta TaxID=301207 RepID=A0ACB6SHS2_9PLEO|nr:uncharacterized protein BU25DRAFT_406382 [Macroventuria anomochaeta]KAF2633130.1 hypothetical protein BU25DRAFT_406382 [Macroventuria anomochaeta]
MSLDEPTKQYHKPPSEDSQHIDLSHKRGVVDRRLINLERNLRIATLSEDRQRYEEEKTQKTHERDMLSLKLEIREIELNKVMKDAEKKKHIEQLKEQVTVGERKEAERLLHSRDATPQAS